MEGEMGNEIGKRAKFFECPYCHGEIKLVTRLEIVEITKADDQLGNIDWTTGLTPEQLKILEFVKENGIIEAFEEAVRVAKTDHLPKNIERFFLTFLGTAVAKKIPRFALDTFIKMYKEEKISYFSSQGVGVILASSRIRLFIPASYVEGKKIQGSKLKFKISANENNFILWLRDNFKARVAAEAQSEMLGL